MSDTTPLGAAPRSWLAALERGRADIAAGRVSELEPFLSELEAEDAAELAAEPEPAWGPDPGR
jgi:hypothetical protein